MMIFITNNDGSKMGKTADGAIWLDEKKLKNYDFTKTNKIAG